MKSTRYNMAQSGVGRAGVAEQLGAGGKHRTAVKHKKAQQLILR